MSPHFHITSTRPLRDGNTARIEYVARDADDARNAVECACERGELDLYHAAIDDGEIDESCPCDECQHARWARFKAWQETWARSGATT